MNIHPDYADLEPFTGRETSDIVYDDATSALSALLSDKGYNPVAADDVFARANPRYFIEVKTTTGPCKTPFFMSKHQYQRVGIGSSGFPTVFEILTSDFPDARRKPGTHGSGAAA